MESNYRYYVTIDSIHDGDTLNVTVDLGFRIHYQTAVRLAGINAPELSTPEGKAAQKALVDYINSFTGQWTIQSYKSGHEKFGRWLADVYTPKGDLVNDWMITNKYAVPFMV